jgi:DNA-binding transcriptional LysR family regulator
MMTAPSLPPLNALRAFEACARSGSVSRAAAELHVTHGAVSRQIRLLEAHLGLALFTRAGRGLRLTPAGTQLQQATATAFTGIGETVERLQRGRGPSALVLGCPGSLLARWMIPRLERLARELPELTLHLSVHDGPFDTPLVGLDVALLIGQRPWPEAWQMRELAAERIGPVLSPRHPDFERLRRQPAAALREQALLHTTSRPQAWPSWFEQLGLGAVAIRHGTGFEHLLYLLEAAVSGLGVAIAPQPLVAADLAAGRLVAPWGFVDTQACWCLASLGSKPADARIERLADWLRQELAPAAAS